MEQIEFILHPDGRVEERVLGVVGNSCSELTRSVEEKLGTVQDQTLTSEYYQQTTQQWAQTEEPNPQWT
ncbi:MAG: DUF2997 domain-containing protein [Gloeobacterales cyanobacterium]